jgi:hypothetical protein
LWGSIVEVSSRNKKRIKNSIFLSFLQEKVRRQNFQVDKSNNIKPLEMSSNRLPLTLCIFFCFEVYKTVKVEYSLFLLLCPTCPSFHPMCEQITMTIVNALRKKNVAEKSFGFLCLYVCFPYSSRHVQYKIAGKKIFWRFFCVFVCKFLSSHMNARPRVTNQ